MEVLDVTVSDAAKGKILALLGNSDLSADTAALRIGVKPGGCSGYVYDMALDTESSDEDVVADVGGLRVVSDRESAKLLAGAVVDYADGLNQAGFSIENPNASRSCGCGNSFC